MVPGLRHNCSCWSDVTLSLLVHNVLCYRPASCGGLSVELLRETLRDCRARAVAEDCVASAFSGLRLELNRKYPARLSAAGAVTVIAPHATSMFLGKNEKCKLTHENALIVVRFYFKLRDLRKPTRFPEQTFGSLASR